MFQYFQQSSRYDAEATCRETRPSGIGQRASPLSVALGGTGVKERRVGAIRSMAQPYLGVQKASRYHA